MRQVCLIALLAVLPAAASAQDAFVPLSDLDIVSRPQIEPYRPDGNLDMGDNGKAFSMVCTIAGDGHLSDCYAEPNTLNDQNFVRHGLHDVGPAAQRLPSFGRAEARPSGTLASNLGLWTAR